MNNTVLVIIDQFEGKVLPASWESLGVGRILANELKGSVVAFVAGEGSKNVSLSAFHYGADQVYFSDDSILRDYRTEPYAELIINLAKEQEPEIILFPTTTRGRELAGYCAAALDSGVLPDVIEIELHGDVVQVTRPVYAGKLLVNAVCDTKPAIITTRGRAFEAPEPDPSRSGEPIKIDAAFTEEEIKTKVIEYSESKGGVSLVDAAVIVSGGRGVSNNPKLSPPTDLDEKEAEIWRAHQGFELIKELASVLGAAVGASRAAVDAGYVPYDHQVGQTGKVVSPDLYIACGISGAIQHLAGMRTSKVIVAINKDPDAPILKLARFGVVGDLYNILPPLTTALSEKLT